MESNKTSTKDDFYCIAGVYCRRHLHEMSLLGALFWRGIYWCISIRMGIILLAVSYAMYVSMFKIIFGTEVGSNRTTEHEEQHFPKLTRDDVLANLSHSELLVTPKNELSIKLMGEVGKKYPTLNIDFWTEESDIIDFSGDLELRVIFNEVSPHKLNYVILVKKDIGLFPLSETPGPATTDLELMKTGHPAIQVAIDEAYLEMFSIPRVNWIVRKNPYPQYEKLSVDENNTIKYDITLSIWFLLLFASFIPTIRFGQQLVEERASGIGEILAIYGVNRWYSLLSWYLWFSFFFLVMAIYTTLVWKYPVFGNHVLFPETSTWVILFVLMSYFQTFLIFGTLVSIFFTNPVNWGVVFFICAAIPSSLTVQLIKFVRSDSWLLISSLHPVGGIYQCISAIIEFEKTNEGVGFGNFFSQPPVTYNQLSVGESILCLYVGALLSSLLMVYFELVLPRKYGIPRPWNFPFLLILRSQKPQGQEKESNKTDSHSVVLEEILIEIPVSVEVQQVHKSFGQVKALNDVSIKIYSNKITSLLGENGAGKTSLMGIITGMLAATKGRVLVDGQDLNEGNNLGKFRKNVGYCPQNDILMGYLTVQQHLIFYSMLTGADKHQATRKSLEWMGKFDLTFNMNSAVSKLSGGMKRKLTICISLARDPKILILDEPTSGLDPVSRRQVWDILLQARKETTIILTTHRMEEADTLSDYIAILCNGNLRVYGSNEFLKTRYGVGYQISFVPLNENLQIVDGIADTIQNRFETISILNRSNKSLVLGVKSNNVLEVMRFVERTYGSNVAVSVTSGTIDDVFVQVQKEAGVRISVDHTDMPPRRDSKVQNLKSLMGCQFLYLLASRYYWTWHKRDTFLLYILIFPVMACSIAMIYPRFYFPLNIMEGRFNAKLSLYGKTTTLISENEPTKYCNIFKSMINDQVGTLQVTTDNIEVALINEAVKNLKHYRTKIIFSLDCKTETTVYYSSLATLALPIAINMLSNFMIRANGSRATIETQIYLQPSFKLSDRLAGPFKTAVIYYFCIEMLNSFCFFMMFPHEQRISLTKHLQIMAGLNPSLYWFTNFLVDSVLVLLIVGMSMTFFVVWDVTIATEPFFTRRPYFEVTIIIFLLYGFSCISFVYLFSYWFKKVISSMQAFVVANSCIVALYYFFILLFSLTSRITGFLLTKVKFVFYLIPLIPSFVSLTNTIPNVKILYNNHDSRGAFDYNKFSDLIADVYLEIIYSSIDIALYLLIVMLVDKQLWRAQMSCGRCHTMIYDSSKVDADVLNERDRIYNFKKEDEPFMVANNLTKSYKKRTCKDFFEAANGVSFAVEKGTFFGILGLNGAGKTTTFKMLGGLVNPDRGDARIQGKNMMRDRWAYMKSMGFCPQSDGLIESMSGEKLLELFGALRGLIGKELKTTVEKWMNIMDMDKIKDRRCGEYSGGNKRKLNIAVSLIGDPSIVLMDEPTTGVDPVVRRKLWSLFKRNQSLGTTFILTSHSLDESEALCDRVTIMAGGYMKCLGPIGQLKLNYAAGFRMIVRMKIDSTEEDIAEIIKSLDRSFQASYSLKDEQPLLLSFEIAKTDMLWSERFDFIIKLKSRVTKINDIVISDSSLEQVYYSVTKP